MEPLRKIVARVKGHYLQGDCVDIDMSNRLIEVRRPGAPDSEVRQTPRDFAAAQIDSRLPGIVLHPVRLSIR